MAETFHVNVVSAEESIFSGAATFVALPGELGELGIYPRFRGGSLVQERNGKHFAAARQRFLRADDFFDQPVTAIEKYLLLDCK